MALEKDDPYDPNIYNPAYTGRVFTWGNNGPGWGDARRFKGFCTNFAGDSCVLSGIMV
jgi:hypothetical protein